MADAEKMIEKFDNIMESKSEEEKTEYFESFGFERETSCPTSMAPTEEEIKDEDCKNCAIKSSCHYINSDEPKSKRTYWCHKTMDSHLKILRAEVQLERRIEEQRKKSISEKQKESGTEGFGKFLESGACDHILGEDVSDEKLHDLMHRETTEELDRTVASEETVFGYTKEGFDKLYDENNGFNVTYPQDPNYLGVDFCKLLKDGSDAALERAKKYQEQEKGSARTRKPEDPEKLDDWVKYI